MDTHAGPDEQSEEGPDHSVLEIAEEPGPSLRSGPAWHNPGYSAPMFELSVQREFRASHAIVMNGEHETPHEHDWLVTLIVCGEVLDADGLLCDFHEVERVLDEVIDPFKNANLNETPPFDRVNPTAERVVQHIAEATQAKLGDTAHVHRATITEAPGCIAIYILPQ